MAELVLLDDRYPLKWLSDSYTTPTQESDSQNKSDTESETSNTILDLNPDINNTLASQYVPKFYNRNHGETNTITVSAQIMDRILKDITEYKINKWNDIELLETEFKSKEVISSNYSINQPQFLKSFFRFKGTNTDIDYILKNMGYDSIIYNDGGTFHQDKKDSPLVRVPTQEYDGELFPCELTIQVSVDINSTSYSGYETTKIAEIKKIVDDRLGSCSYLSRIILALKLTDYYDPSHIYDDFVIKTELEPWTDEVFEYFTIDPIKYGRLFNNYLKYGNYNKTAQKIYGAHKIIRLKPISDAFLFTRHINKSFEDTTELIEVIKDRFAVPTTFKDTFYQLPTDEITYLIQYLFDDNYKQEIIDAFRLDPEILTDNAIDIVKFARKYLKNTTMQYNLNKQNPSPYTRPVYGKQEHTSSPTAELVIALNGETLHPGQINLSDTFSITIKSDKDSTDKQ